uniref:Probable protein-export membrane protein SecG n=1 Tax=Hildenbrandia rivularis TaxID=135206 RepID=A0A1C9CFD4_9FLOR|nr:hypothetical protein Hrvl_017 [Hildenbrandia rivularis]AOM67077.1 hypothetical protein Hrvl_017 [Hildenbrandia rivularis]
MCKLMSSILQLVRYSSMLLLIFLILSQSPKVDGINSFGRTTKFLNNIRDTESLLNSMIWTIVLIFFISTMLLAIIDIY